MKPQMNTDKHRWIILGLIIVLFMAGGVEAPYSQDNTLIIDLTKTLPTNPYQEEYERMLYPAVRIKAGFSTGSGVIISHRGTEATIYILSAGHVVGNNSTVTVESFYPKNIELEATVIITDTSKDLALLRARSLSRLFQRDASAVKSSLAPKDYKPYLFSPVWAVGCSLGLPPRPSYGYLCALCDLCGESSYWEVSSPILPGNSGGPVYDARTYEVIGIAIWVHTYKNQLVITMAGVVPINQIYEFLEQAPREYAGSKSQ